MPHHLNCKRIDPNHRVEDCLPKPEIQIQHEEFAFEYYNDCVITHRPCDYSEPVNNLFQANMFAASHICPKAPVAEV